MQKWLRRRPDGGILTVHKPYKVLIVGRDATAQAANLNITIRGDSIELVPEFKYLGSMFNSDNTLVAEINHRVASAGFAWHQLKVAKLWSSKYLTLPSKISIFRSVVLSILLYASETWPALPCHITRLEVFQMNCLRAICGFSLLDRKTNASILQLCKLPSITGEVRFRRLRWLGHLARTSDSRLPKKLLFGQVQGTGTRGRPMDSWNTIVCKDLASLGVAYSWHRKVEDRTAWRQLFARVRT